MATGILSLPAVSGAANKVSLAYVSDSPASSAAYWVAHDAGLFKKHGLDVDMIFINGSTRSVQSLVAGDLNFAGAVETSAMNGRMAGGDIFIIDGLVNRLPYYLIGKREIKSPEDLRGRSAATHIPGTSADFTPRLALKRFGIKDGVELYNAWVNQYDFQRLWVLSPDVLGERVEILRKAFKETLSDPEFLAEAEKTKLDVEYVSAEEINLLGNEILDISPETKQGLHFLVRKEKAVSQR